MKNISLIPLVAAIATAIGCTDRQKRFSNKGFNERTSKGSQSVAIGVSVNATGRMPCPEVFCNQKRNKPSNTLTLTNVTQ